MRNVLLTIKAQSRQAYTPAQLYAAANAAFGDFVVFDKTPTIRQAAIGSIRTPVDAEGNQDFPVINGGPFDGEAIITIGTDRNAIGRTITEAKFTGQTRPGVDTVPELAATRQADAKNQLPKLLRFDAFRLGAVGDAYEDKSQNKEPTPIVAPRPRSNSAALWVAGIIAAILAMNSAKGR